MVNLTFPIKVTLLLVPKLMSLYRKQYSFYSFRQTVLSEIPVFIFAVKMYMGYL